MPESLKPDKLRRKLLSRRAEHTHQLVHGFVPESLRKTPSQKKSEYLRKKLNRDAPNIDVQVQEDCRDCPKHPCGESIKSCKERSFTKRCSRCGLLTMYRVIIGGEWKLCKKCRDKQNNIQIKGV